MPWTEHDYPDSMKNMDKDVRSKAIEIANALLREGYPDERAIPIAMDKARDYVEGDSGNRPVFEVKEDGEDWVLRESGKDKNIFSEDTKKALLDKAKEHVNKKDGILKIYKGDGDLEDTLYRG
ncbi:DUF2188 domain-containing protein [Edaphobacillus lindanitolerans]|uniref:DUF2188 domain-containing protein n=1 Tax=Edaphobacillus lindanitolerans TaxID=550447 RepID=A0A1U7PRW7_9BACI|nr:hypothetical protein [Edaphobacillus lindanitolerans]SIT88909.1 hypothetical protein SAMN05428946_2342 [Edaphobacillus lindanitolerans]